MTLSLIVAMSENGVIGHQGDTPWHISQDLQRFKRLTMGHHMIMGRKTFDSIGRLLPGRTTVILTRNRQYSIDGAIIAHCLSDAIEIAKDDDQLFIVGGGQIYHSALRLVTRMYVTRVHVELDGDTRFPEIDWGDWSVEKSTMHLADKDNDYNFTFEDYERNSTNG